MTDDRYYAAKSTKDEINIVENIIYYLEDPLSMNLTSADINYLIDLVGGSSKVKELAEIKKERLERRFEQL